MATSKLPALRPDRIVRALVACGFVVKRQSGSHIILVKPSLRRPVVVPQHRRELPPGFIADLLAEAQVPRDDFLKHI